MYKGQYTGGYDAVRITFHLLSGHQIYFYLLYLLLEMAG